MENLKETNPEATKENNYDPAKDSSYDRIVDEMSSTLGCASAGCGQNCFNCKKYINSLNK